MANYYPGSTSTITITSTGASGFGSTIFNTTTAGTILTSSGSNGTYWSSPPTSNGLHVRSDAEFDGDIKWKGRSLGKLLESIEDRLAILQEPEPEKLEKFAALKKAYDHYKLMEKLIGED